MHAVCIFALLNLRAAVSGVALCTDLSRGRWTTRAKLLIAFALLTATAAVFTRRAGHCLYSKSQMGMDNGKQGKENASIANKSVSYSQNREGIKASIAHTPPQFLCFSVEENKTITRASL